MAKVGLYNGGFAIVDECDLERVLCLSWRRYDAKYTSYAVSHVADEANKKFTTISMHRLIMEAPAGILVDHENRDGLDNSRLNLRYANRMQNGRNSVKKRGISAFKGVSPEGGRWRADIRFDGRGHFLGFFDDEIQAAAAYNAAARTHFGEFALLNAVEQMATRAPHLRSNNKSGYRGVKIIQTKIGVAWAAAFNGKYIATFTSPIDAAIAYNKAAIAAGRTSKLNPL